MELCAPNESPLTNWKLVFETALDGVSRPAAGELLRDPAEHFHSHASKESDGSLCQAGGMWELCCWLLLTACLLLRVLGAAPELQALARTVLPPSKSIIPWLSRCTEVKASCQCILCWVDSCLMLLLIPGFMRAESNQQIRLNLAVRKEFDKAPNIIESLNLRVTPGKLTRPVRVLLKRTMWTCSPVIGTAVMRSPQAFDSSVTKTGVFPRWFMGQVDRACCCFPVRCNTWLSCVKWIF